jgi:hypothetical protein
MQRVTLVRYETKPEFTEENAALARAVFSELRANTPKHIAYGLFQNGNEFVHVFINVANDDASMLVDLPSFQRYSKAIAERCEVPPQSTRFTLQLLDSYGLPSR